MLTVSDSTLQHIDLVCWVCLCLQCLTACYSILILFAGSVYAYSTLQHIDLVCWVCLCLQCLTARYSILILFAGSVYAYMQCLTALGGLNYYCAYAQVRHTLVCLCVCVYNANLSSQL